MNSNDSFWITRHYLEILDSGLFLVNVEVLAPEEDREVIHSWNVDPRRYRKDLERFFKTRKYRGTTIKLDNASRWTGRFTQIPRELWFDTPHLTIVGAGANPLSSISIYEHFAGSNLVGSKATDFRAVSRLSKALDAVAKLDYDKFVVIDSMARSGTTWHPDAVRIYDLSDEVIMMLKLQI